MKQFVALLALAGLTSLASAQTAEQLRTDGTKAGNTDNVLTYGMGYHQNRYSPQIGRAHV